jgi:hypothetical protein
MRSILTNQYRDMTLRVRVQLRCLHLWLAAVARKSHLSIPAMPANEEFDPIEICFIRTQARVAVMNLLSHLIQKTRWRYWSSAMFHKFMD